MISSIILLQLIVSIYFIRIKILSQAHESVRRSFIKSQNNLGEIKSTNKNYGDYFNQLTNLTYKNFEVNNEHLGCKFSETNHTDTEKLAGKTDKDYTVIRKKIINISEQLFENTESVNLGNFEFLPKQQIKFRHIRDLKVLSRNKPKQNTEDTYLDEMQLITTFPTQHFKISQTQTITNYEGNSNHPEQHSKSGQYTKRQDIATIFGIKHTQIRNSWEWTPKGNTDDYSKIRPTRKPHNKKLPALVNFLIKNMTLSSEHRLAQNCINSSEKIQIPPVVKLLHYIAKNYLYQCISVILYDDFYETQYHILQSLMNTYPLTYVHGKVMDNQSVKADILDPPDLMCRDFLLLIKNIRMASKIVGDQRISRIIVVSQASRWGIEEFLSSPLSQNMVNLLVVGNQNAMHQMQEDRFFKRDNMDMNLYTHDLFVDGLGSSSLRILTAWRCDALTRSYINLFPTKFLTGFKGHRFVVAAGHQPPFVVKRGEVFDGQRVRTLWDGLEIRILWLIAEMLNFSFIVEEPKEALHLPEASNAIVKELLAGRADIGVAGVYTTPSRITALTMSSPHTQDCGTFITLASTALPRYRAIMGPFHWTVWLALTLAYLLAIFPISFSDSHSLKHLLKNPWQIENMFWYVFGTFTNCFTFKGKYSWSHSDKAATRMLIGWYWIFSIIVSACYTGSIIAFVTLPVYPSYVESCRDVLKWRMEVGTLSEGGWRDWFSDSEDPMVNKLFEKMEYLPDLESAMHNVTVSYYRNYAFLGSWSLLDYLIRTNFTLRSESKRSFYHLGKECFVPFNVALTFPLNAPYSDAMNQILLRIIQSGLIKKLKRDLEWDLRRTSSGKLLAASSDPSLRTVRPMERMLNIEDVQGTFLLLGAGFAIATFALFVEIVAWIVKKIKSKFFSKNNYDNIPSDGTSNNPIYSNTVANAFDEMRNNADTNQSDYAQEEERIVFLNTDELEQPVFNRRLLYRSLSADARLRHHKELNEQYSNNSSDDDRTDRLKCLVQLQSLASLPATGSTELKKRRKQTPRPSFGFSNPFMTEANIEMSTQYLNVPDNDNYNRYEFNGDIEATRSSRAQLYRSDTLYLDYKNIVFSRADRYFGDKVRHYSHDVFGDNKTNIFPSRHAHSCNEVQMDPSQNDDLMHSLFPHRRDDSHKIKHSFSF